MRAWLKDCLVRTMDATEAAWLAGFFDGEGSLVKYKGWGHGANAWFILVSNTDRASLERCREITEVGIIGNKEVRDGRKPQYTWRVQAQRNVMGILQQIAPYLVTKRVHVEKVLSEWEDL